MARSWKVGTRRTQGPKCFAITRCGHTAILKLSGGPFDTVQAINHNMRTCGCDFEIYSGKGRIPRLKRFGSILFGRVYSIYKSEHHPFCIWNKCCHYSRCDQNIKCSAIVLFNNSTTVLEESWNTNLRDYRKKRFIFN